MCDELVRIKQYLLKFVLDCLKKQEICSKAMCFRRASFFLISDRFETQETCTKVVEEDVSYVFDPFKTQDVYGEALSEDFTFCNIVLIGAIKNDLDLTLNLKQNLISDFQLCITLI